MAIIKKYDSRRNPSFNKIQWQQSLSVTGAATSDTLLLPAGENHGFGFTTTGSGTLQVTFSSEEDIDNGNEVWYDADITGGASLSADTVGSFRGVTAIQIVNASGTSSIEVVTS